MYLLCCQKGHLIVIDNTLVRFANKLFNLNVKSVLSTEQRVVILNNPDEL